MTAITREFVKNLPKLELHVHVEACITADTMEELAGELGVPMIRSKAELFQYDNLSDFLTTFEWWVNLLRSPEIAEEVAYKASKQLYEDNVLYAEVFTGLRYWGHIDDQAQVAALCRGFKRAHHDGYTDCRLIPSISREQSGEWALNLVEWLAEANQDLVIGIGLDGNEELLGPTSHKFVDAYERAAELGLGKTAHCGESSGADGVWDGLNYLDLDRVDHGVRSIEDPLLVQHLVDNKIPLTICPTSNDMIGIFKGIENGPINKLYRAGVPVTINSDDPECMMVTTSDDFEKVAKAFNWTREDVISVAHNSIDAAFCDTKKKSELRSRLTDYVAAQQTGFVQN